jgi:ribonuclease HI
MDSLICANCDKEFQVQQSVRERYPSWVPKFCLDCHGGRVWRPSSRVALGRQETLNRYQDGPQTGIFTDGFCEPNPGRGGWGVVKVIDGQIGEERSGSAEHTTNNRMEMIALIEGYKMLAPDEALPVYSDSELCVNTITKWAPAWKRKGWRRKGGEIKNLDLVKELYELAQSRPRAELQWIRGHSGTRWNEYADALSREDATEQRGAVSKAGGTSDQ